MAGHARYTALLDACVLFPVVSRDALLSLAAAGLFAAKWSERIETEWTRALESHRPDLVGRLQGTIDLMRAAIAVTPPAWGVRTGRVLRLSVEQLRADRVVVVGDAINEAVALVEDR